MSFTVEIDKEEYEELLIAQAKLQFLEGGGVDNWEGYSDSLYPDIEGIDDFDAVVESIEDYIKNL